MWPFYHRFTYPVTYLSIELSPSTPLMLDPFPLWSSRPPSHGWALCRVNPADYLSLPALRRTLRQGGVDPVRCDSAGLRVWLVTCGRYLGHAMNPISYYLCYEHGEGRGRGRGDGSWGRGAG